MKHSFMIIILSVLLANNNIRIIYAVDSTTQPNVRLQDKTSSTAPVTMQATSSAQAPTTKLKPKIAINDSELCKKCSCDIKYLQIDCSNKSMASLFSAKDWQTLQNGDVLFEVIKLNNNEILFIPPLPTYPVKSLYMSYNKINNISIGAFQNFSQLTVLDLSHNKLTSKSLSPHVFRGMYATDNYEPLKNLKTLDLSHNEIHTLNSNIFEHMPALEILILSKNTFHVVDMSTTMAISSLNFLKTLDISYMELGQLPDTIFHGPIDLETLILTGNLFTTLPIALKRAKHLKKLVLDELPLIDFENSNVLASLEELEYLSISYLPDITKIGPWELSNLQNLTTLIASNNPRLAHIHKFAFAKNTSDPTIFDYPPLKQLLLHNNNLTTVEHNWIVRWDKITEIDLRFNPWACDCTNNWFIHSLMKQINSTMPLHIPEITCASPSAWKNKPIINLTSKQHELLCVNPEHPNMSSLILLGLLVGVLLGIPLTLGGLVIYRKGCFGILSRRYPTTDRSLYSRASFADEFYI